MNQKFKTKPRNFSVQKTENQFENSASNFVLLLSELLFIYSPLWRSILRIDLGHELLLIFILPNVTFYLLLTSSTFFKRSTKPYTSIYELYSGTGAHLITSGSLQSVIIPVSVSLSCKLLSAFFT